MSEQLQCRTELYEQQNFSYAEAPSVPRDPRPELLLFHLLNFSTLKRSHSHLVHFHSTPPFFAYFSAAVFFTKSRLNFSFNPTNLLFFRAKISKTSEASKYLFNGLVKLQVQMRESGSHYLMTHIWKLKGWRVDLIEGGLL